MAKKEHGCRLEADIKELPPLQIFFDLFTGIYSVNNHLQLQSGFSFEQNFYLLPFVVFMTTSPPKNAIFNPNRNGFYSPPSPFVSPAAKANAAILTPALQALQEQ